MATVQNILQTEWNPTFALRPGSDAPLPSYVTFSRGSAAWTLDEDQNISKQVDGEHRIHGSRQGLRVEPQRTQLLASPQNLASNDWTEGNATVSNRPAAKGQDPQKIIEDSTNSFHFVETSINPSDGDFISLSFVAKATGRDWVRISSSLQDNGGINAWFNVSNGDVGQDDEGSQAANIVEKHNSHVGGGWYHVKFAVVPTNANDKFESYVLALAKGDGSGQYAGDGTSGATFLYAQAEVGRFVTSLIPNGLNTRNADDFDLDTTKENGNLYSEFTAMVELEPEGARGTTGFERILADSNSTDGIVADGDKVFPVNLMFFEGSQGASLGSINGKLSSYQKNRVAFSVSSTGEVVTGVNGETTRFTNYNGTILDQFPLLHSMVKNNSFASNIYSLGFAPAAKTELELSTLTSIQ